MLEKSESWYLMFLLYPKQKYFSLPPHLSILTISLYFNRIEFHFSTCSFPPFQPLYFSSHCPKIRCDNIWLFESNDTKNLQDNKAKKLFWLLYIYIPFHALHLFCFLNILVSLHIFLHYMPQILLFLFALFSSFLSPYSAWAHAWKSSCHTTDKVPEYFTTES